MNLINIALFYLIAGSAGFIRRKLDPDHPKPEFDYCFNVLFRTGIALFVCGVLSLLFPSDYWLVTLIPILAVMLFLIFKQLDRLIDKADKTAPPRKN